MTHVPRGNLFGPAPAIKRKATASRWGLSRSAYRQMRREVNSVSWCATRDFYVAGTLDTTYPLSLLPVSPVEASTFSTGSAIVRDAGE